MLENIFGNKEQADLKREFLGLRGRGSTEREQVPYSRQAGIVWRVSEELLVTGFDIPAIDCCVVVVFGEDKAGMMHISPNTLPEDFVINSGERYRVSNTDVLGKPENRTGLKLKTELLKIASRRFKVTP